jgi:hypothetical protein
MQRMSTKAESPATGSQRELEAAGQGPDVEPTTVANGGAIGSGKRVEKPRQGDIERPHRRRITFEDLPLFADERSLSEAFLGPGKYRHWRAVVQVLEVKGFPKIDGLMGGRYWPAVKAFFDREYRVSGDQQVSAPHAPAELGAYSARRRKGKS